MCSHVEETIHYSLLFQLGYGKSCTNRCLWVGGLPEGINTGGLKSVFRPYGSVRKVTLDEVQGQALVLFSNIQQAKGAMMGLNSHPTLGIKIMVSLKV